MRTAHNGRKILPSYAERIEHFEAVHSGHFEIEHQNIRLQPLDALQTFNTITRNANQFHTRESGLRYVRMTKKDSPHNAAHNSRVISGQHAQRPFVIHLH